MTAIEVTTRGVGELSRVVIADFIVHCGGNGLSMPPVVAEAVHSNPAITI
jgi:hypothetical protein